jgi:integrase
MRGSIIKRGAGYSYVLYLGRDETGRKKQKWVGGFRTRKDAEKALAKVLDQVHTGVFTDPGRMTVGEYLEQWLDGVGPSLRAKSAFSYADTLRGYVIPRVGSLRLADLTATRLRALYSELLESGRRRGTGGLSARTVGYTHRIVSHALKDAMRAGLLARNPAEIVSPPRAIKPEGKTWTAEQVAVFLQHVDGDRLRALWVLLATTGMRRGEALGLKWSDVDVKAGRVTIRRALVLAGYEVVESLPKTAASNRAVFLHPQTTAALREHRRAQNEERLAAGPAWSDLEFVFTDEIGASLHPDRVTKLFVQHAHEAGLPKIRLHDLRHTVATLALTAGVHTKVVQELFGHANVAITLDVYSHVAPELHEKAALSIGALIYGAGSALGG